jgi:hypothetical protein
MPSLIPSRLVAACGLALALSLPFAAVAGAKGFTANLRVVGAGNKVLAEKTVKKADDLVKTSSKAVCFGSGSGGSGSPAAIEGTTPLGLLSFAATSTPALRPLLITDHFSFGLALCGIGKSVAKGEASWFFKVDHKSPPVGGDQVQLHSGDEVLWDLAPSYPYPNELALTAPEKATAGTAFTVHAWSYDEKGKRTPAAGVKVTGAAEATAADGTATVKLAKPTKLIASDAADSPSARVAVCVGGKCPAGS